MSADIHIAVTIKSGDARLAVIEDDQVAEVQIFRDSARPWVGETLAGRVTSISTETDAAFVATDAGDVLLPYRRAKKAAAGKATSISDIVREGEAVTLRIARAAVPNDGKLPIADLINDADPENGLIGLILDIAASSKASWLTIDDSKTYIAARRLANDRDLSLAEACELWTNQDDLFETLSVAEAIDEMTAEVIRLPSGGCIRIEPTRALTAIDVDTGAGGKGQSAARTRVQANIEAATTAAQAIRFLGLGGLIVIDFIDMQQPQDRDKVLAALDAGLKRDPARPARTGFSKFGLVEISRRMRGPSLLASPAQPKEGEDA